MKSSANSGHHHGRKWDANLAVQSLLWGLLWYSGANLLVDFICHCYPLNFASSQPTGLSNIPKLRITTGGSVADVGAFWCLTIYCNWIEIVIKLNLTTTREREHLWFWLCIFWGFFGCRLFSIYSPCGFIFLCMHGVSNGNRKQRKIGSGRLEISFLPSCGQFKGQTMIRGVWKRKDAKLCPDYWPFSVSPLLHGTMKTIYNGKLAVPCQLF